MPITLGNVTLEYKSLPLLLREDGSAQVTVRKGYLKDDVFVEISRATHEINAEAVSQVLDVAGIAKATRRDDLSFALYSKLLELGLVEQGDVS